MIARAAKSGHFTWMTDRSGYDPLPDARGIEAVRGGVIYGMAVLDGYTETLAQVHVALATPMAARCLLALFFRFAFHEARRAALITMIDASNTPAARMAQHVGFREAYRVLDGMRAGVDLILYEMRREECRYLEAH